MTEEEEKPVAQCGKPAPMIDGLTGDQRFFLAYAQSWRTKMREKALRARVATDGHVPGNFRVLTVRNLDDGIGHSMCSLLRSSL